MVYAYDVNMLGRSLHTIEKNTEALVVASKQFGLEVNAKNGGWSHNINTDNKLFGKGGRDEIFGTTLTDQNSIKEELTSRLNSGNTCYHLVQNLMTSGL